MQRANGCRWPRADRGPPLQRVLQGCCLGPRQRLLAPEWHCGVPTLALPLCTPCLTAMPGLLEGADGSRLWLLSATVLAALLALLFFALRWLDAVLTTPAPCKDGLFSRQLRETFLHYADSNGRLQFGNVLAAFADVKLRFMQMRVREMLRVVKACSPREGDFVYFGEFCLLVRQTQRLLHQPYRPAPLPALRRRPRSRSGLRRFRSHTSLSNDVFLGGSCNPTTWRSRAAIPYLSKHGMTYYNPQVDEWSPDLIEIEAIAKEQARVLFFVVDNETRGIASMVEIAYLAASGRNMVVVMNDFDIGCTLDGRLLTQREVDDLNRGHDFLCSLLHKEGVPLFEDLALALEYTSQSLNANSSMTYSQPFGRAYLPVMRGFDPSSGLYKCHSVFQQYDEEQQGSITLREAELALKTLIGQRVEAAKLADILGMGADAVWEPAVRIDWSQFCSVVAEFELDITAPPDGYLADAWNKCSQTVRKLIGLFDELEDTTEVPARDVFLGGSCGETWSWRRKVAIPRLRRAGLSVFNPEVKNWSARLIPLEELIKRECTMLLYVIDSDTRGIGALVEAAYYIGAGRSMVLCVSDVHSGCIIGGKALTDREAKDLNRGRAYLMDFANRRSLPCCESVGEAVDRTVAEFRARKD